MSADLASVCAHPGASERPMDGDVPPETLSLVRQCVRAVIAQSFPYDRESLTPVQVRAVVATKCGLVDLGAPALREIVFEELSHVADDEALRAAQRVFERLRRSLGQVAALCRSPVLRSGSAIRGDLEHVAVHRDEAVAQAVPEAVRAYNLFWAAQIDDHLAPVTARLLGVRVLVSV